MYKKTLVNDGINYRHRLVSLPDFWLPSTVVTICFSNSCDITVDGGLRLRLTTCQGVSIEVSLWPSPITAWYIIWVFPKIGFYPKMDGL